MKVKTIEGKNFKGIEHLKHEFKKPVTVVTGPVGVGKTSFIQAFRYALTNEIPFGTVRIGADSADVTVICENASGEDDIMIERSVAKPAKKSTKVMGRKTGTSASESFIEESTNVSNDVMKIATSSEALAAMKPAQFGAIFLNESVEKKTLDDLIEILKNCDLKEKKALMLEKEEEEDDEDDKTKLPADVLDLLHELFKEKTFNLEAINKAFEEAKAIRRDTNALYKSSSTKSKDFLTIVKPEYSEATLNKKYEEIIGVEKNVAAYKEQVKNYKTALGNQETQNKRISELNLNITMNRSKKPDAEQLRSLTEQRKLANQEIVNQSKVYQTLSDNLTWFKRTYDQLDKPVCPISKKLVCTTDKTDIKDDIKNKISEIKVSMSVINDKIKEAESKVKEIDEEIVAYNKNKESWNKKEMLIKERDRLVANPIKLPPEPEKMSLKSDYTEEKEALKEKLNMLHTYKAAEKEYKETLRLKRVCAVNDFVVKALDPKGPVIKEFIETFVECLEDACNERARLLKTGFELKLIPEDGLKVLFKTDTHKEFLPYSNLSAGERIFASLILTDLINNFYASKVLILDDIDHLDANTFKMLMDFLDDEDIEELYDNIIISCVEHDDMLDVIEDYDVDLIKF